MGQRRDARRRSYLIVLYNVGLSGCRAVGLSGCRAVGLSGCRAVGLSGCRAVGLSGCRAVGLSGCRAVGLSGCRAVGLSGCRAVGLSGCRAVGSHRPSAPSPRSSKSSCTVIVLYCCCTMSPTPRARVTQRAAKPQNTKIRYRQQARHPVRENHDGQHQQVTLFPG